MGYEVTVSNHEYPDSVIGKIMGKLHIPLLLYITDNVISRRYINGELYDVILIVKGRGISIPLMKKLKQVSPKIVGYTFDSFQFNRAPLNWLNYANHYYTFDYRDGEQYSLPIVELFSSMSENNEPKSFEIEISAILRNHSDRLRYISKVFTNLPVENKYIYIFEQNLFTFIGNFIWNPFLYIQYFKYIFFKPLPYAEYARIMRKSNFTIDFAHPKQTGITIRCFEALSSQTKIITNNPFVSRYRYFDQNNTIVFTNSSDPTILKDQYRKIREHLSDNHNRTIIDVINDLIS